MERKQFTFYRSYYEAVRNESNRCKVAVIIAIADYSLNKVEPNLTKKQSKIFESLRPIMDTEIRQSEEGRRCFEYKNWRKSVFARDDYTCQICGKRGVRLNAHHIKSYAYFPNLRFSVDNGITLCEECHKSVHRKRKGGGFIE